MAAHGPLTRPLPTVIQSVGHQSSAFSDSVHNSLESCFHLSSSSSNSSVPPLPKGARAPSPQPSSPHTEDDHSSQNSPRQGCLALSWSFEWRGISRIIKWALKAQVEHTIPTHLPLPSPQFARSTAALAEDTFTAAQIDTSVPRLPTSNPSSRLDISDDYYHSHAQSEHGHVSLSFRPIVGARHPFPSNSEVHLPRAMSGKRKKQRSYPMSMPTRQDLNHIAEYNDSVFDVASTRNAFSDCGHTDDHYSRVSWITTRISTAYSDSGNDGTVNMSSPPVPSRPQIFAKHNADISAAAESTMGIEYPEDIRECSSPQQISTLTSLSNSSMTGQPRKLRKHQRTKSAAAVQVSQMSLVTSDLSPRSKPLPPTPELPQHITPIETGVANGIIYRPRKLTKRRIIPSSAQDALLLSPMLRSSVPNDATVRERSNAVHVYVSPPSTENVHSPRMRPSFLRTESNRRWTVAVADVPDELLIEELERLRRLGMRAGEVHGSPSQSRIYSCQDLHAIMTEESADVDDSVEMSEIGHIMGTLGDEQEWGFARRAILCCRELVKTERTYLERLEELARKQVSDSVPPLVLQYLPALIVASSALSERFADDPSAWGVSIGFLSVQSELESAYVAWCGVVGEFFSELTDTSHERVTKRARMAQTRERRPSVLKRPQSRNPSSASGRDRVQTCSMPKHVIVACASNASRSQSRRSPSSGASVLHLPTVQEPVGKSPPGLVRGIVAFRTSKGTRNKNRPSFRDIAILPTQRVTRYVLLFKDLLKHTPLTSPSRDAVEKALACSNNLAIKCDRAQGNANFLYNV